MSTSRPLHVGHYVLSGVLGEGAMSTVYLAQHRATGRFVALKALRLPMAGEEEARTRMRLEARVLGKVRARHLVDALDAGTMEDGSPYLVLEHLDGRPVSEHLAAGPIAIDAAVAIADGVLEALEALHVAGFVHRDVKPGNVVLARSAEGWTPKLIDLGVCLERQSVADATRVTARGTWVGTPCYMAPEQLDGRGIDPRTDVYGVGALLHECLVGQPPHEGRSAAVVASGVLTEPVVPVDLRRPDCPPALASLVARALSKSPYERPQSASAMRAELDAVRRRLGLAEPRAALAAIDAPRALVPVHEADTRSLRSAHATRSWRSLGIAAALASSFASGGAFVVLSGPATAASPSRAPTPVLDSLEPALEPSPVVPAIPSAVLVPLHDHHARTVRVRVTPRSEAALASDPDLSEDAAIELPDAGMPVPLALGGPRNHTSAQ